MSKDRSSEEHANIWFGFMIISAILYIGTVAFFIL